MGGGFDPEIFSFDEFKAAIAEACFSEIKNNPLLENKILYYLSCIIKRLEEIDNRHKQYLETGKCSEVPFKIEKHQTFDEIKNKI